MKRGRGRGNKLIAALNAHVSSKTSPSTTSFSGKPTTVPIHPITYPSITSTDTLVKQQVGTIDHSKKIARDLGQKINTAVEQQLDVDHMTLEELKKKVKEQQQDIRRYAYTISRLEGDLQALRENYTALGDKETLDRSALLQYVKDHSRTDPHFEANKVPGSVSLLPPQTTM